MIFLTGLEVGLWRFFIGVVGVVKMSDGNDFLRLASTCQRNETDVLVGRNLRRARIEMRITIADLARLVDLDERLLCSLELGFRRPSPVELDALSRSLGKRITYFFKASDQTNVLFSDPGLNGTLDTPYSLSQTVGNDDGDPKASK